jgi:hypothetical protein
VIDSASRGSRALILALGGLVAASVSGCRNEEGAPLQIIGKTRVGNEVRLPLASRVAGPQLAKALRRLDRSTLELIDSGEVAGAFELRRVTVGLELEAEVELGDVVELGGEGAFELRYERLPL